MSKSDRRFNLITLLGFITLIAASLGLIRFGGEIQSRGVDASPLLAVGALWLAAAIGAVGGFVIGGRQSVVSGAIVGVLLAIPWLLYWLLPDVH